MLHAKDAKGKVDRCDHSFQPPKEQGHNVNEGSSKTRPTHSSCSRDQARYQAKQADQRAEAYQEYRRTMLRSEKDAKEEGNVFKGARTAIPKLSRIPVVDNSFFQ